MLKSIGASTVGLSLTTGSAAASGLDRDLKVLINPARDSDVDRATNEIYDALDDFLEQLTDENAIPGYDLTATNVAFTDFYDDPGRISYDCAETGPEPGPLYEEFIDETSDDTRNDVRLLVTDDAWYAGAEMVHAWDETRAVGWVGTSGKYAARIRDDGIERMKNAAIQETAHALIDHGRIPPEKKYADGTPGDQDHALGTVRDGSTTSGGPSTPMLVFYENEVSGCRDVDLSGEGCTDGNEWNGTHTQTLNSCTIETIKKSVENNVWN